MKLLIIGSSGHALQALDALPLHPEIETVAIAPGHISEDMTGIASALASIGQKPRLYDDWHEAVSREAAGIAVVNPWYCMNAEVSAQCLAQGMHVFTEKPVATDSEGYDALLAAYLAAGHDLAPMFDLLYSPWFLAMEREVASGAIGRVRLIHGQKSYKLGRRGELYRIRALYGGMIPWVGIHMIGLSQRIAGDAVRVAALSSAAENRGHGEMETTASFFMEQPGGVITSIDCDYLRPDASPTHGDDRLRITGTEGMIESIHGRVYLENELPRREVPLPPAGNPFEEFLASIGTERAKTLAREAFSATRTALAARDAADAGRVTENRAWNK